MISSRRTETLDDQSSLYVFFNSGGVEELRPADGFRIDRDEVVVLYHQERVASFSVKDVLSCGRQANLSPSPFN
jgi:hypothetical protein